MPEKKGSKLGTTKAIFLAAGLQKRQTCPRVCILPTEKHNSGEALGPDRTTGQP
jgi:hypothetical protein